jgi:hypothetical protein
MLISTSKNPGPSYYCLYNTLSSTKLEIRTEQFLPVSEGMWGRGSGSRRKGEGRGWGEK